MRHNMRLHDEGASIKDYLVPMAWGDPGLGKSDIAEAVADDLGWELVYADLATRDPADLGGMPWVTDGRTVRCRPDWLPSEGRGILFLDELPQAGLANLNIAATLIREHRIGEHRLPPTWMVACAGNYQHNRAGTTTMPSHVRNRLLHLDINADANAWAKWASARGINPMLIAYNRYRAQEFHHKFSATDNAYPTPRSWTASHQVLRLDLPEPLKRECTGGMIGPSAGADFTGFCEIYASLPDVNAIIADPDHGVIPSDPMTSHALMGALSYHATPAKLRRDRAVSGSPAGTGIRRGLHRRRNRAQRRSHGHQRISKLGRGTRRPAKRPLNTHRQRCATAGRPAARVRRACAPARRRGARPCRRSPAAAGMRCYEKRHEERPIRPPHPRHPHSLEVYHGHRCARPAGQHHGSGLDRRKARPRHHPRDLHHEGRGGQRGPRQQEPAR